MENERKTGEWRERKNRRVEGKIRRTWKEKTEWRWREEETGGRYRQGEEKHGRE